MSCFCWSLDNPTTPRTYQQAWLTSTLLHPQYSAGASPVTRYVSRLIVTYGHKRTYKRDPRGPSTELRVTKVHKHDSKPLLIFATKTSGKSNPMRCSFFWEAAQRFWQSVNEVSGKRTGLIFNGQLVQEHLGKARTSTKPWRIGHPTCSWTSRPWCRSYSPLPNYDTHWTTRSPVYA